MEEHLINGGGGVRKSLQRSSIVVMILNTIKYPNRAVLMLYCQRTQSRVGWPVTYLRIYYGESNDVKTMFSVQKHNYIPRLRVFLTTES